MRSRILDELNSEMTFAWIISFAVVAVVTVGTSAEYHSKSKFLLSVIVRSVDSMTVQLLKGLGHMNNVKSYPLVVVVLWRDTKTKIMLIPLLGYVLLKKNH